MRGQVEEWDKASQVSMLYCVNSGWYVHLESDDEWGEEDQKWETEGTSEKGMPDVLRVK